VPHDPLIRTPVLKLNGPRALRPESLSQATWRGGPVLHCHWEATQTRHAVYAPGLSDRPTAHQRQPVAAA
jgi:hypothetical protein